MVPVSSAKANNSNANSSETNTKSPAIASTTEPSEVPAQAPQKSLSPQARKNQKLQQQLEKSIAEAIPIGIESDSRNFIASLAPNKNGKALTITLDSGWYQLEPEQQEAIASVLWDQRDSLKFQQLKLQDTQGKTIARNPVVGDQMVILRR